MNVEDFMHRRDLLAKAENLAIEIDNSRNYEESNNAKQNLQDFLDCFEEELK